MTEIILTGVKVWLCAFVFLMVLVFFLHVMNKWDD
jgi:hypothetical protein